MGDLSDSLLALQKGIRALYFAPAFPVSIQNLRAEASHFFRNVHNLGTQSRVPAALGWGVKKARPRWNARLTERQAQDKRRMKGNNVK